MESLASLMLFPSPTYGLLIFALALILSSIKPEYKALIFISSFAIIVNVYSLNIEKIFIERAEIIKIVSAVFGLEVLSALLNKGRFYELISLRILGKLRSPNRIFILMNLLTALLSAILSNVLVLLYMVLVAIKLAECIPEFDPRDLVTSLIIVLEFGFDGDIHGGYLQYNSWSEWQYRLFRLPIRCRTYIDYIDPSIPLNTFYFVEERWEILL